MGSAVAPHTTFTYRPSYGYSWPTARFPFLAPLPRRRLLPLLRSLTHTRLLLHVPSVRNRVQCLLHPPYTVSLIPLVARFQQTSLPLVDQLSWFHSFILDLVLSPLGPITLGRAYTIFIFLPQAHHPQAQTVKIPKPTPLIDIVFNWH